MDVEDVMSISGRGTVATGRVERGELRLNDPVEIVGIKPTSNSVATGIEMFSKTMDFCEAGDNLGVLLRGVKSEEIERGQVLAKPGTCTPHKKFTPEVYDLTKDEGGRHTPDFNGYRPQVAVPTTDDTGNNPQPEATEMGELVDPVAMEPGLRVALRAGGHTVGDGRIAPILD